MEQKPINKIDSEVYKKQAAFINQYFKFVDCDDLYTFDKLLSLAKNVKEAWDYQGFLIDPYNSLIKNREVLRGISSHEYDYEATSRIRLFCKNYNVSVWLNTHASTEALRKRHSKEEFYAGHPIPPMASDVEGGGKFVNRADDFLVIHRYIQHPNEWMFSHIHVRKVKDIDTGGRPTPMDEPIRLRSITNNVGFEVNFVNPLTPIDHELEKEIPF